MRDRGMAMPAAVVALSPVTDLTLSGDTAERR
jgi:acetyl esterase/lipase